MTHKLTTGLLSWAMLTLMSAHLHAATIDEADTGERVVKSISYATASTPDKEYKDQQLKQSETRNLAPLSKDSYRLESNSVSVELHTTVDYIVSPEFTLFDATTDLLADFDYDGFHHRFSVNIDADTIHSVAYVYAKLYLSYEGGPWEHFATSDAYHIYGNSELDSFSVETELADGFPAGYYDIRIELYDADFDHWLLSYGPYDDPSLFALPLEDSYRDDVHPVVDVTVGIPVPVEAEVVVSAHHGAMSPWWLLLGAGILALRQLVSGKRK